MPRFCAEILATGSQCTQFARKSKHPELSLWCRAHADPVLRERNADTRQLVAMVADMNLFSVANLLGKIASELRLRLIQPLHAQVVIDATLARLDQLTGEQAGEYSLAQSPSPHPPDSNKPHENNRLHLVPIE